NAGPLDRFVISTKTAILRVPGMVPVACQPGRHGHKRSSRAGHRPRVAARPRLFATGATPGDGQRPRPDAENAPVVPHSGNDSALLGFIGGALGFDSIANQRVNDFGSRDLVRDDFGNLTFEFSPSVTKSAGGFEVVIYEGVLQASPYVTQFVDGGGVTARKDAEGELLDELTGRRAKEDAPARKGI